MARNGIESFNRGSKGMNHVISGKLAKYKTGLIYPQGDYPIEKYVIISVYSGDLANSIEGITNGMSKIQGALQKKIGEAGNAIIGAVPSGKVKDIGTVIAQSKSSFFNTAKSTIDKAEQSDQPAPPQGTGPKPYVSNAPISDGGFSGVGDIIDGIGSSFKETVDALDDNHLGNGSVADHAKTFVTNIYLPLPNEIQEALSHSYEEEAGWFGTVKEHIPGATTGIDTVVNMASIISKMTGSRSVTFDKNRVSMFTESAFRSINLSWSLVPNDKEESKAIHEIVKSLKKYSSPESVAGKILLKSPHFFRLKFGNKQIDKAMQFYEVVITEIGVDYSPGGGMEMHHDDMPKTISLSISFKDREPKLMEDWDKSAPVAGKSEKPSCNGGSSNKTDTKTDNNGNSSKVASAGGGSNASENSGKEQAEQPIDWRDGNNDLANDYIDWEKSDLIEDSLENFNPDINKKLPAEENVDSHWTNSMDLGPMRERLGIKE